MIFLICKIVGKSHNCQIIGLRDGILQLIIGGTKGGGLMKSLAVSKEFQFPGRSVMKAVYWLRYLPVEYVERI